MADVNAFFAEWAAEIKEHLQTYIRTDGKEGYYRDMSGAPGGGDPKSITLILRTRGRKSGETRLAPLLYNHWKDDFVIVASKAGADEHPSWFLNMTAAKAVDVQIKNRRYRCTWRVSEGDERAKIWPFMVDYYPPFDTYQARTQREIPVVVLTPVEEIEEKFELGSSTGVTIMLDRNRIVEAILEYSRAENQKDKHAWLGLFSDRIVHEDPVGSIPNRGTAMLGKFWDGFQQANVRTEVVRPVIVCGNEAVAVMRCEVGPPDSRIVIEPIVDHFVFDEDGKITGVRVFFER
jgi:deazaflavin-dependent oxidoreductase (nitroreductase family)